MNAASAPIKVEPSTWTAEEADELYSISAWGKGYFRVGRNGNLWVHPTKDAHRGIDLKDFVDKLELRGISRPVLLRFGDIVKTRLQEIHDAFAQAMREHSYRGLYSCIYPIKVNQQRPIVEEVIKHGSRLGFGLEAGSKPELLAVMALANNDVPIICNGFKDDEYIEMVMLARKIGRKIIPVVEKFSELAVALAAARRVGVDPTLGIRIKLATKGSGRWKSSGGFHSKFGLSAAEALAAFDELKRQGLEQHLKLLHFHVGSQITNIRQIKAAVVEATRIYTELKRAGAGLEYLDVGGGLGIDYDGSQTDFESSINYTLQEYAADVVYHVMQICDEAEVDHPIILSESGRAISAYHSVLIFDTIGVSGYGDTQMVEVPGDAEQPLLDLQDSYNNLSERNLLESFHDAQQALESAISLFNLGYLPLSQRSVAENLYWAICKRILLAAEKLDEFPEELEPLRPLLSDIYFCNFSLFQSVPDSWAVKQLFPVAPIHRLNQRPTRDGILADISCDSDGKIDRFIDRRDVKHSLPLHAVNGEPYLLGIFLVGAYQEILGDLHNLFGDTNAVHVTLGEDGHPVIDSMMKGDTVSDVLRYVQYDAKALLESFHKDVEAAVRSSRIGYEESGRLLRFYEEGLNGYTYLE